MKTARDLILELYKEDHITTEETNLLLDVIEVSKPVQLPYVDWTYRHVDWAYRPYKWTYKPYEQPNWTITNNTDTNNVE